MAFHTRRVDFLHKRIVHKKFQLKIPTLSKNDCSATWKPNTYQKYDTCGKVRNVQRYQKYVVILRSFIFIVSDIFKPTVYCQEFTIEEVIYVINRLKSSQKKFTIDPLFTIDRFTIGMFDCTTFYLLKNLKNHYFQFFF